MPTIAEILYALRGFGRLFQADPQGLEFFDRSVAGFWRSFRVAFLVLPAYAILIPWQLMAHPPTGGWQRVILVEMLMYIISWLAFPVAAFEICRRIGRETPYFGLIVVYNWSSIVWIAVSIVAVGLQLSPSLGWLGQAIAILGQIAILVFVWFIARIALSVDGMTAFFFAILELGLTWFLWVVKSYIE